MPSGSPPASRRVLIASRKVLLPSGTIGPAVIEITGARIAAVYEGGTEAPAADVDYGDALITPAFVDAHTHLSLSALRTCVPDASTRGNVVEEFYFGCEAKLDAAAVRAFVRVAAYELLLAGVGLVWDHYYFGRAVAEGLRDAGLGGVVAPTLQDLAGPGRRAWEAQLAVTAEIDDDDELAAAGIGAALGPHATDTVSDDLLERTLEMAETRGLPVHLHLGQSLEELERAQATRETSPVGWLERRGALERATIVGAHGIFVSDDDLARLRGHALVWCPRAAAQFGFAARPDRWERAGVRWAIATDCAAGNDGMSPQAELGQLSALRAAAATHDPSYEAFLARGDLDHARRAWGARTGAFDAYGALTEPAALLSRVWSVPGGFHPRLVAGTLAPGALASLAVWDLEHPCLWPGRDPLRALAFADATKALHALWVAGRRIGRDGALTELRQSAEYREALREANGRLAPLLT